MDRAVFTCSHVILENQPVLYVEHDLEGDWQFLCGQDNHSEADAKIVSLKQVTKIDPSLNDLYEMSIGFGTERTNIGKKWSPFKSTNQ